MALTDLLPRRLERVCRDRDWHGVSITYHRHAGAMLAGRWVVRSINPDDASKEAVYRIEGVAFTPWGAVRDVAVRHKRRLADPPHSGDVGRNYEPYSMVGPDSVPPDIMEMIDEAASGKSEWRDAE